MEGIRIREKMTKVADGSWLSGCDIGSEARSVRAETTEFGKSRLETSEAADGDEDGVETI